MGWWSPALGLAHLQRALSQLLKLCLHFRQAGPAGRITDKHPLDEITEPKLPVSVVGHTLPKGGPLLGRELQVGLINMGHTV